MSFVSQVKLNIHFQHLQEKVITIYENSEKSYLLVSEPHFPKGTFSKLLGDSVMLSNFFWVVLCIILQAVIEYKHCGKDGHLVKSEKYSTRIMHTL